MILGALALAAAVQAAEPLAAPEARPLAVRRFKVLAYNIKDFPAGIIDEGQRGPRIGAALAARLKAGNAPDVVLLQEAFAEGTRGLIAEAGYPHHAEGPDHDDLPDGVTGPYERPMGSGLHILSLHPIASVRKAAFGRCAGWDCIANKGVLHVTLSVDGVPVPLEVVNTHMNANRDNHPWDTQERVHAVRKRQIELAGEFLAGTMGRPTIFAGDFNVRPNDPNYPLMFQRWRLASAGETCLTAFGCEVAGGSTPDELLLDAVDHHFYRGGAGLSVQPLRVERNFREEVDGERLSDHLGYEVEYELRWAPPTTVRR